MWSVISGGSVSPPPRARAISAWPWTVRGQPQPAHRLLHRAHRGDLRPTARCVVRKKPTRRSPVPLTHDAHPQQPQRADDHQRRATTRHARGAGQRSRRAAMITAAKQHDTRRAAAASAAAPTRQGPGPVGAPPAVVVVERQRDVLRARVECAVGRQEGQGHD